MFPGIDSGQNRNVATDRTGLRPITARNGFADDGNRRRALIVVVAESPPRYQVRSNCLQEIRRNDSQSSRRFLSWCCERLALRLKENVRAPTIGAGAFDAWYSLHRLQNGPI